MNKDQTQGRIRQAKGTVKEVVGKVFGNEDLAQEGKVQKIGGKVQARVGDLQDDVRKIIQGD